MGTSAHWSGFEAPGDNAHKPFQPNGPKIYLLSYMAKERKSKMSMWAAHMPILGHLGQLLGQMLIFIYLTKIMFKNRVHAHIWAYVFAIFGPIGLKFCGNSGEYNLSIG